MPPNLRFPGLMEAEEADVRNMLKLREQTKIGQHLAQYFTQKELKHRYIVTLVL